MILFISGENTIRSQADNQLEHWPKVSLKIYFVSLNLRFNLGHIICNLPAKDINNMFFKVILLSLCPLILLNACSSGKSAYKKGDYYEAVLASVQRLRQKPDHKKSREILRLSYPLAIEFLEASVENELASNANFKYSSSVKNYERINRLYEEIRTSPGALKIIPKPVSKYNELNDVKAKAAEETYEAGIQAMMKNTREDAKKAFFLFSDANNYSPGYREAIEMIEQARFNATLKVVVQPFTQDYSDWDFEPVVFGYKGNQFVKFYSPRQATDENLNDKIDQYIRVEVNGFSEDKPVITKRSETYTDSVKTGEKTVNGKKVPIMSKVTAKLTTQTKQVTGRGSITLFITDAKNGVAIHNSRIVEEVSWSESWASYTGDARALSEGNKKLAAKREPYLERDYLPKLAKEALEARLANELRAFYSKY